MLLKRNGQANSLDGGGKIGMNVYISDIIKTLTTPPHELLKCKLQKYRRQT